MTETLSDIGNREVKHKSSTNLTTLSPGADTGLVELVPLVSGKRIVVVGLKFTGLSFSDFAGGLQAAQVEFYSGSTALTGLWEGTFDLVMDAGYNPDGHFQTAEGEALQYKITDNRTSGGTETAGIEAILEYIEK
jgi:hypothetical protein